jgi:uncharacterized RDD family membrane protein YckC
VEPSDDDLLYPSVPARIKAGVIDAVLLAAVMAAALVVYTLIGYETQLIILFVVAVFLLYEPLFVSYRGATVGHRLMGFQIIDGTTKRTLSFTRSFVRFFLKTVLGIVSIVAAYLDKREQFLHDRIVGSRAILATVAVDRLDSSEERFVAAKAEAASRFALPSLTRRIVIVVLYCVLGFIATSLIAYTIFPQCADEPRPPLARCDKVEEATGAVAIVIVLAALVAGLKGNLPGARKRVIVDGTAPSGA